MTEIRLAPEDIADAIRDRVESENPGVVVRGVLIRTRPLRAIVEVAPADTDDRQKLN